MPPDEVEREEKLRQLVHDLRHCLYVIGLNVEMLKDARDDGARFEEICASMNKERKDAANLINELTEAARGSADDSLA